MTSPPARRASLDQFRGLTVVGMILVNFAAGHRAVPAVFQHHNTYCSLADTIMPQFFFAVGYALRLTHPRRVAERGRRGAALSVVRRCVGLLALGLLLYKLDGKYRTWADLRAAGGAGVVVAAAFQRSYFQTLVHIALASLWVLPVIGSNGWVRLGFGLLSAGLHLAISHAFYFEWAWSRPVIDGGPAGFLAWTVPVLVGAWACDVVERGRSTATGVGTLLAASAGLMVVGQTLAQLDPASAAWPFLPPSGPIGPWAMSQRAASVSYLVFASGWAVGFDALLVLVCDRWGLRFPLGRLFGQNALAAYVVHGMVEEVVGRFVPDDAPGWYVMVGLAVVIGLNALVVGGLERAGVRLRL